MSCCLCFRGHAMKVTRMETRPSQTRSVCVQPFHETFYFFVRFLSTKSMAIFRPHQKCNRRVKPSGRRPFCGLVFWDHDFKIFCSRLRAALVIGACILMCCQRRCIFVRGVFGPHLLSSETWSFFVCRFVFSLLKQTLFVQFLRCDARLSLHVFVDLRRFFNPFFFGIVTVCFI